MKEEQSRKLKIALVGLAADALNLLYSVIGETCDAHEIVYDMETLCEPFAFPPALIFCGLPPDDIPTIEVAQALRMHYPTLPINFVTTDRKTFNRKLLIKNGFTDAFLLPADSETLREVTVRALALQNANMKAFRNVQLVDLSPGEVLGFDLYLHLPANNKKILYVSSAESMDPKKLKNLEKHKVRSGLVSENQMQEFYKFSANQLKKLGQDGALSETEKKDRRERAIRDLLSSVFGSNDGEDTLSNGREIMADCQEIVKSYITESSQTTGSWYSRLLLLAQNTNNSYNHASNVATLAALISIGLGYSVESTQEISLAGLLCDIGLIDVPPNISAKPTAERTPEEAAIYQKHADNSIKLIQARKIVVTEKVMKIISQHHERFDGSGYPSGHQGPRICIEAQILGLADEIDELMKIRDGKPTRHPGSIITELREQAVSNPGAARFDPNLIKKVSALFLESAS